MYDFHYNYIKNKYRNAKLLFTDTDSLTYHIKTEDAYADFYRDKELFNNSDYPSAIAPGGVSLIVISTTALLIKAYMEHQRLDIKIQNCQYAFQSYNRLLIMIKDAMGSGNIKSEIFITAMHNVDNYVTDNTPIVDKYFKKYDVKFSHLIKTK